MPFPTAPPYTAYVGNMSFESSAEDVKEFFSAENLTVTNVRTVTGFDGKSKGFCYAEFAEAEMLRHALTMSGAQLGNRAIRVSVAEPRKSSFHNYLYHSIDHCSMLPSQPRRALEPKVDQRETGREAVLCQISPVAAAAAACGPLLIATLPVARLSTPGATGAMSGVPNSRRQRLLPRL